MGQSTDAPIIVFGAFDRHNFGDLLFPHIVSSLLRHRRLLFAGLADRDLRSCGGHRVRALPALLAGWKDEPPVILHAGGELLACDLWEAAVMLQTPSDAQQAIRRWDDKPEERHTWASRYLGAEDHAPYMAHGRNLPGGSRILYNAVGGVDLGAKPPAMRYEVLDKLRRAGAVGVRDTVTLQYLQDAQISCDLLPDPAVLTAELFDAQIQASLGQSTMAALLSSFTDAYIAVQLSTDFGDDATLKIIAEQLVKVIADTGCGLILFRAGTAPWHDDLDTYRRLAAQLPQGKARLFDSVHLWDICALIARSRAYCGSSLHGRIIAMAYGLPRINIVHEPSSGRRGKQAAYAASWESVASNIVVPVASIHPGLMQALSLPLEERQQIADHCALAYRHGFADLCRKAGI